MSRLVTVLLALLLAAGPVWAQGEATQAPAIEPGTKLSFAPTVGGATLTRSTTGANGSIYQYATANGIEITVDVYGNGRRVPAGSLHPTVVSQFNDEIGVIQGQATAAGFRNFEKPAVPSSCTYGAYTFRCTVFSVVGNTATGRVSGKFLLIGYREHFVKIIARWSQQSGRTTADADAVLNAFVPALLR